MDSEFTNIFNEVYPSGVDEHGKTLSDYEVEESEYILLLEDLVIKRGSLYRIWAEKILAAQHFNQKIGKLFVSYIIEDKLINFKVSLDNGNHFETGASMSLRGNEESTFQTLIFFFSQCETDLIKSYGINVKELLSE
jgi:hypothetical protein